MRFTSAEFLEFLFALHALYVCSSCGRTMNVKMVSMCQVSKMMSTSQTRDFSALSHTWLHIRAIRHIHAGEPQVLNVFRSRASHWTFLVRENDINQPPAHVGMQTDIPAVMILLLFHLHANSTCIFLIRASASEAGCVCWVCGACLWLIGRILPKQEVEILMCLCVTFHVCGHLRLEDRCMIQRSEASHGSSLPADSFPSCFLIGVLSCSANLFAKSVV